MAPGFSSRFKSIFDQKMNFQFMDQPRFLTARDPVGSILGHFGSKNNFQFFDQNSISDPQGPPRVDFRSFLVEKSTFDFSTKNRFLTPQGPPRVDFRSFWVEKSTFDFSTKNRFLTPKDPLGLILGHFVLKNEHRIFRPKFDF